MGGRELAAAHMGGRERPPPPAMVWREREREVAGGERLWRKEVLVVGWKKTSELETREGRK
jgi:hypothetical protein